MNIQHYPKDLGNVLNVKDIKWASKQVWAPDCVEKDGRYYFVFPARDKESMFELIWQSDNHGDPFAPRDNYIEGSYGIDPCIFPDTDGNYYMTFGGGQLGQYRDNKWGADNKEPQGSKPALGPKIALIKDNLLKLAESSRDILIVNENGKPLEVADEERKIF